MDNILGVLNTFLASYDLPGESARVPFSNVTLLSMMLLSLTRDRPFPKTKLTFRKEYDYIIVGGGSAGSVMANRLSQKPCVSVLLLEAGGNAPVFTDIPGLARLFYQSKIDWTYRTTPQKYAAFSQIENRVIWNSGKVLGGSSVLNAMLNVRGNMKNYDDWEREGATGWSYRDVLPYFKMLEDNLNINELDKGYHGIKGPMTVEKPNYIAEIKEPLLAATAALGFELRDPNGRRQTGIYDLQATIRNGKRCSTAKAYLVPAENRPNLDILKYAFARKILIRNKRAYGVQFDFGGKTRTVLARKEVILSLGTIRTPQILMLSGIGPREHLKKFNISVVSDLPVGQNLQDHCASAVPFTVSPTIKPIVFKTLSPISILQYLTTRSGPLVAANQCSLMGFLDGLGTTAFSKDFPRQEFYWAEFTAIDALLNHNLKPEIYEATYGPYQGKPSYICIVHLLQPRSRGEILLESLDPYDQPLINPNYYKDERDLQDVVEGLKVCLAVGTRPEMKKVQSQPYQTIFPGCEQYVRDIDKYFSCQARNQVVTYWHYVGTARMGQPDDPRSVVDPQLRVIGVKGLRVISAAVMPIVPSGNTNIPTIMVAEKAYDMMKNDVLCEGEKKQREKDRVIVRPPQVTENMWNDTEFTSWLRNV